MRLCCYYITACSPLKHLGRVDWALRDQVLHDSGHSG